MEAELRSQDKVIAELEAKCAELERERDRLMVALPDAPVKGPRYDYQLSYRQIARMNLDWDAAENLECMAGLANAFVIGWTMAASRGISPEAWNDLVGKLDALRSSLTAAEQRVAEAMVDERAKRAKT